MKIAISTTEAGTSWPMMFEQPMGAGNIRVNLVARELARRGHEVDVWTQAHLVGEWNSVRYVDNQDPDIIAKRYDAGVGNREPVAARWINADRRYTLIHDASHWQPMPPEALEDVDKALLVGQTLYELWLRTFPPERLDVMPEMTAHEFIDIDETKRNPQSVYFACTPTHSSGLHIALEAMRLLDRPEAEFHIYGSAAMWYGSPVANGIAFTEEYQAVIDAGIERVPGKVIVHGALPWPEMQKEHTKHSILIHPKTHETFGCSVAEAMWAGAVPVVASENALRERVCPGVDGFWCTYDHPGDFAKRLTWLLDHPEERSRMAARAHDTASAYLPEKVMPLWEEVLRG